MMMVMMSKGAFDDTSIQKYGQFITQSLSCSSLNVLSIGGLQKSGKFIRSGDTF